MLEGIYGWIQNISVYLIVMAAVMHAIPGKDYGKYIRFFSGLVLILLLAGPLLKLAGMEETFRAIYSGREYEIFEQAEIFEFLGEAPDGGTDSDCGGVTGEDVPQEEETIKVEEIEIGK